MSIANELMVWSEVKGKISKKSSYAKGKDQAHKTQTTCQLPFINFLGPDHAKSM